MSQHCQSFLQLYSLHQSRFPVQFAVDVLRVGSPILFNRQISVASRFAQFTGSATGSAASRPLTPHYQPLILGRMVLPG